MPLEQFQKMVFSGFFGVPKNSECHLYNKICITSLTFYSWSLFLSIIHIPYSVLVGCFTTLT
ncbi:hypothetical protein, partial [Shouchella rhizosphaerae]|uniref:hypothetical protein n=1 Tax=Shouchella rhizosphaerae TaxID=866786 RepID=UPI00203D0DCA